LKVTKIHRGISYTQKSYLRSYIELNTGLRKKAVNDFEKDLFKLMSNAVFGKTMENVRGRHDFKFQTTQRQLAFAARNPMLQLPIHIYNENLTGCMFFKPTVTLDKPIYAGASILDLSKLWMCHYWYDHLIPTYGAKNLSLCFTDTDSFCFKVETPDFYADMKKHKEWYDTSNYPPEHPLYSSVNKKVPGLFKDEFSGRIVREFVGLKAKMYSVITDDILDSDLAMKLKGEKLRALTAKGVSGSVRKALTHEMFRDCLLNNQNIVRDIRRIGSTNHVLTTMKQKKVCGNAFDDKAYIISDDVETLKYGHRMIKTLQSTQ
jgi:hypothetical protein